MSASLFWGPALDQRYYASTYGRFNSPDPYKAAATGATNPSVPSSWNRYSYVHGDPVNFFDRHGTCDDDPNAVRSGAHADLDSGCYCIEDYDCEGGGDGGGGDPDPPQPPQPTPTCEQQLTSTITGALAGTPLASEASDFVEDAESGGLNPLLLVAIAGAESSYGTRIAPGSNNPFGLLHSVKGKGGKIHYAPIVYANWNSAINGAVSTVDKEFVNGNVTVADLYSGLPGAYCVGAGCSKGEANVASIFQALGGGNPNDPLNLRWPCKD